MIALLKSIVLGAIGSMLVSLLIYRTIGALGGKAAIQAWHIADHNFYWSWPIFLAAGGLAFAIFKLME